LHNILLGERTTRDIDTAVAKILKDIGNPEPPLSLEVVRDLLELDRAWYSSKDDGALREVAHRMKLAGKQVFQRPTLLVDAVKKFSLKALWHPDSKRILLDADIPDAKKRWNEAHEIGHSLIPWHESMCHGDHQQTLSYSCHQQIEAEANYAGGRLLFLQERFAEELHAGPINLDRVKKLGKQFGNTITSSLWRAIESLDVPAVAMISQHPRDFSGDEIVRYFIRSRRFSHEFSALEPRDLFDTLGTFCRREPGPIGQSDLVFADANGQDHIFNCEAFHNRYDTLTLAVHVGARPFAIAMS
jgi:Zn-dependent peptidase ImmA (M78 family)